MPAIVAYLGNNKFLTGEQATYVDFFFWETIQAIRISYPDMYTDFPTLQAFHDSFRALSGVKEYFDDENCIEHTYIFNNKVAKINGTAKC